MIAFVLRVAGLATIYLLTLSSLDPYDVLFGVLLGAAVVWAQQRLGVLGVAPPGSASAGRLAGVPALVLGTALDTVRGAWHVARHCLSRHPTDAGLVTVPIRPGQPLSTTAWAIRVGFVPDTVVVEAEEEGELLLHVLDARDPAAVRADQEAAYRSRQRRVFP